MGVTATNETSGYFDMVVEQGIDKPLKTFWKDSDGNLITGLENWDARMQIRNTISSDTVLIELTKANNGIILGDTVGEVTVNITSAQSNLFEWSTGVYDIELIDTNAKVTRYLRGKVSVVRGVTR